MRRTRSILKRPVWYAAALVNESHLIDLFQRGKTAAYFGEPALAKGNHTLFNRRALDFGSGAAVHNHFANMVGQIQQFADGGAAVITSPRAFQAARAFHEEGAF